MGYTIQKVWVVTGKFKGTRIKKYKAEFDHYPTDQEIVDNMISNRVYGHGGYSSFDTCMIKITEKKKVVEVLDITLEYNAILDLEPQPARKPEPEPADYIPLYPTPGSTPDPAYDDLPF